ncbi:MAG: 2TM domain-containing protein [Bacteroidetes bacterium]|nr:2TM domain-containing protein [Bacteroidota bacterium]
MNEQKDEKLWRIAKQRANFQDSLVGFVVITVICWAIWYLTAYRNGINLGTPWPLWVMLGLGIGLVTQFIRAYKTDNDTLAEREYEKLKRQQEQR